MMKRFHEIIQLATLIWLINSVSKNKSEIRQLKSIQRQSSRTILEISCISGNQTLLQTVEVNNIEA